MREKGENVTVERTIAEVAARDARDEQREVAPLRMAEDALLIDSTGVSIENVLARMEKIVREKESLLTSMGASRARTDEIITDPAEMEKKT